MGGFLDKCAGDHDESYQSRRSYLVLPTDLMTSLAVYSDVNDDKFIFIKNESEIDKNINRLDELFIMSEQDATQLDQILHELRILTKKYTKRQPSRVPFIPSSLTNNLLLEVIEDSNRPRKGTNDCPKFEAPEKLPGINRPSRKSELKIKQGHLTLEIQKATFLHPKILKKHELSDPYVSIKVYFDGKKRGVKTPTNGNAVIEIASFTTSKEKNSLKPEWNELFEYDFKDEERGVSGYKVGISLYYKSKDMKKGDYKVGEEQIFSLSSLFDQRMQLKRVDYKDSLMKGSLGKLSVRFQFIYDAEEMRARMQKEIKTKMEKLCKVRERHPVFQYLKKGNDSLMHSVKKTIIDMDTSSVSSIHEDIEARYYMACQ